MKSWAKDKNFNDIFGENVEYAQEIFVPSKAFVNQNNRKLERVDTVKFMSYPTDRLESDNFNDFIDNMFSIWVIKFDIDDWSNSHCTSFFLLQTHFRLES